MRNFLSVIKSFGIPTAYALALRVFYGLSIWEELFSVMSVSFLFLLPAVAGGLTVYFSPIYRVKKKLYRILAPWVPITVFFAVTIALTMEGWACWIMVMPLFLAAASVGGLIGGYLKMRNKDGKVYVSVLLLLPLFLSPIENSIGALPGTYEAYTFIDIDAPADKIWSNVTRVRAIEENQDKGWLTQFLGFPRPVRAELNFEGVGAYREAVFTNGLIFHETVSEYEAQKKMVFSIKAYPHEIPSTTMDEHVVIGGKYFDVLNGTYELEKRSEGSYRLHLYSHFKLSTTFNFYASWWAKWIMKDIQNNILQIEKNRSEMI
ncbi:MAG: hypothetical protein C0523_01630 [Cytophaga sp.]|nr:hypothetical protein [Cytophaga sp.]